MFSTSMASKKGFTLIEMLIVVAIIGILAGSVLVGLGPVQKGGRDARRVSDLKNVQNGLELYYNKNQRYPTGVVSWSALQASLTGAGIGVRNIPSDPKTGATYYYATDATGSTYVIGAILEDASGNAVNSSYQGSPGTDGMQFPGGQCGTAVTTPYAGFLYCTSL